MNISLSGASDPQRLIASEVELNWSMVATSLNRGQFPPTRAVYPLKIRLRSSGNGKREPFEQHLTTRRKLVRRKRRISNVRHAHVITAGTLRTSKRPSSNDLTTRSWFKNAFAPTWQPSKHLFRAHQGCRNGARSHAERAAGKTRFAMLDIAESAE